MNENASIISALGGGSGIDMISLAENLATAQFQLRTSRLAEKSETLERQISAASSLKNSLNILASSLGDRVRVGDLSAKPSVANASVASASTPLGLQGSGDFSLEVSQLASSQSLASPAFADAEDVVGAGTITLRFGTIDGASFTADGDRDPIEITIDSGSSLKDIASAINNSGAGVDAYIARTNNGDQLMIKGEEGAANGFVIETSETPGEEGLAALAWEPVAGDPALLTSTSQDAIFELDGLEYNSASNDTGVVAPGLELHLTGTNVGDPTQISFANPGGNVTEAMRDLVGALNSVVGDLRAATDSIGGDLSRDPGARALKQAFSQLAGSVVMPTAPEGAPRTLSDLGLVTQRDGTFTFDADRLAESLERDPDAVSAMFTTGLFGVYGTFDKLARTTSSITNPGSLAGSITRYERMSTEVSDDVAKIAERQETLRANMVARFARADTRITAAQSTLTFLQSQIDAWNSGNN